jgi:hypothetical protein
VSVSAAYGAKTRFSLQAGEFSLASRVYAPHTVRQTVAVTDVAERRRPASAAATMYAETPESRAAREQHGLERRLARPLGADLGARPTKQARRRLDALRRAQRRGR